MSKLDGTLSISKTFPLVERVRTRTPLKIYWLPLSGAPFQVRTTVLKAHLELYVINQSQ